MNPEQIMEPMQLRAQTRLWAIRILAFSVLSFAVLSRAGSSAELKPETVKAWEQYLDWIDARVTRELATANSYLIQDFLAPAQKARLLKQLREGQIFADEMKSAVPAGVRFEVPDALIHHWWGSILVPRVTLKELLVLLQDYDHHAGKFADVEVSRLLSREGDTFKFYFRLRRTKAFVTAHFNALQECTYTTHDPKRVSSRSIATRIAEIENAGTPEEREKTPGMDRGFLWGLASWWRFYETGEGVIIELESASLSRNIPALISILPGVSGFIRSTPRESLTSVLASMRTHAAR